MDILKPKDVVKILNISMKTLQRWDVDGTLPAYRNPKNRRYYTQEQIDKFLGKSINKERKNIAYVRVFNEGQKEDLEHQIRFIQDYMNAKGVILDEIISDIDSGLSYKRKNWNQLLDMVINKEVNTIYVSYKDRFVRLGFDWFESLCNKFGTNIVALNNKSASPEEELVEDLISIIHVFSCRIYELRKYKPKIRGDFHAKNI